MISSTNIQLIKSSHVVHPVKDMNTPPSFQTYESGPVPPGNRSCQKLQPAIDPGAWCVRIKKDSEWRCVSSKVRGKTQSGGINVHIRTGFYASEKKKSTREKIKLISMSWNWLSNFLWIAFCLPGVGEVSVQTHLERYLNYIWRIWRRGRQCWALCL